MAMRRDIRDLPPSIETNRERIYHGLTQASQQLIDNLYGGKDEFIKTGYIDPIEPYILEFDQNLGNIDVLAMLAVRIGARVLPLNNPNNFIYDALDQYIELSKTNNSEIGPLERFLDIDQPNFFSFAKRYTTKYPLAENSQLAYDQRLLFAMQLYDVE